MNDTHILLLQQARNRLVEHRRTLAKILALATDSRAFDSRLKFVDLQLTIEAIDRAIQDEKGN